MTTNSQLSATKPKKTKNKKQKQTKRTTRMEQNHRNGDHMVIIGEGEGRE